MAPASIPGGTPLLGHFLTAINGFVSARNEAQLASYLVLEPPFGEHYTKMITELRNVFPRGREEALEQKISGGLSVTRDGADGSPWLPFAKFMLQYLTYLRDVDPDPRNYLLTYDLLAELQQRANSALNHPILGSLMLPVVVANAKLLCRLAIGLDKQPALLAQVRSSGGAAASAGEDGGPRETLPERAANILRNAFVTCLNDRASSLDSRGKPEGKKRGIYTIANLCLRILFQCGKTRNATQIFENIYNLSPPLAAYPKSERVTYLYYLGRFFFQNSHFYRAQVVLQRAYDEAPVHPNCTSQRRQILIFLLTSNIILGRIPSQTLLSRPEAQGLTQIFAPICTAIQRGDLATFRSHLSFTSPYASWLLKRRILLPLRNRAEVLVWRSLVRRTWLLNGTRPDPSTRIAPTIDIHDLVAAFTFLERRCVEPSQLDPDFAGLPEIENDSPDEVDHPDATALESVLSSLIDQGLLGGYVSHARLKFAITGSKAKGGALAAGFPNPWGVLKAAAEREGTADRIPGWKVQSQNPAGGLSGPAGGFGPGMVVNLSGLRSVGAVG